MKPKLWGASQVVDLFDSRGIARKELVGYTGVAVTNLSGNYFEVWESQPPERRFHQQIFHRLFVSFANVTNLQSRAQNIISLSESDLGSKTLPKWETGFNADGQEIQRSQCHISPAQREASEFLILTFSDDRDTIALLPHRIYWPVEGEESTGGPEPLSDEIPASTLSAYSFSITLLLANIEEVKRSALNPMHPSTTLFQIGLDGKAPKACEPEAIMPQALKGQITESDQSTLASSKEEEKTLRTIHEKLSECCPSMKVDFLDYQPLLRDFKIIITSGGEFPNGLEAVINHSFGRFNTTKNDDNSHHLTYADYLLSHSVPFLPNVAYFIPRRLIPKVWFTEPHGSFPELCDSGRHVRSKDFIFQMNDAGRWVRDIWKIICKYPPDEHPTPAEKKQEIWKKALPWPEIEAQEALQKGTTQQKARRDKGHSKHDSGTGDGGAVEPSDVSQLPTHYLEKASSDHKLGRR